MLIAFCRYDTLTIIHFFGEDLVFKEYFDIFLKYETTDIINYINIVKENIVKENNVKEINFKHVYAAD